MHMFVIKQVKENTSLEYYTTRNYTNNILPGISHTIKLNTTNNQPTDGKNGKF